MPRHSANSPEWRSHTPPVHHSTGPGPGSQSPARKAHRRLAPEPDAEAWLERALDVHRTLLPLRQPSNEPALPPRQRIVGGGEHLELVFIDDVLVAPPG